MNRCVAKLLTKHLEQTQTGLRLTQDAHHRRNEYYDDIRIFFLRINYDRNTYLEVNIEVRTSTVTIDVRRRSTHIVLRTLHLPSFSDPTFFHELDIIVNKWRATPEPTAICSSKWS